jgi:hypothetical protein
VGSRPSKRRLASSMNDASSSITSRLFSEMDNGVSLLPDARSVNCQRCLRPGRR